MCCGLKDWVFAITGNDEKAVWKVPNHEMTIVGCVYIYICIYPYVEG